jgi:hypothetical protein
VSETPAAGPAPPPPADETQAVRAAAQWIVAAAGAVGAALVAGLQIGDIGKLVSAWPALVTAILAFAAAMTIVGHVIRAAGRVLVVCRTTISDLLRQENRKILERRGHEPPTTADPEIKLVFDEIINERAWLLAGEESFAELFGRYEQARLGIGPAGDDTDRLHARLDTVTAFARATLTRTAYERLCATITGWPGRAFILAVLVFAVALGWPVAEPPAVTAAYRLDVLLTGDQEALRRVGLNGACRTGTRLTGVALGGSLAAPEVVTEPRTTVVAMRLSTCDAARFTVTSEVGIPIPYVK